MSAYRHLTNTSVVILLAIILSGWFSLPAHALSAEEIVLETSVDRQEITIGDPITLTVRITRPAGTAIVEGRPLLKLDNFDILGSSLGRESTLNGQVVVEDRYRITLFDTGSFEIPRLSLTVVSENDEQIVVESEMVHSIQVLSVIENPEAVQDIREIKNPVVIGDLWWQRALPWALGALIVLILLALLFRWWRRRREDRPPVPVLIPTRPAHEVALEALERLRSDPDGVIAGKQYERFSVLVSQILRTYLYHRDGYDARDRTTDEIMDYLEKEQYPRAIRTQFQEFLDDCDLVKFARETLDDKDMEYLIDLGRRLVEQTIVPTAPAVPEEIDGTDYHVSSSESSSADGNEEQKEQG